MKRYDNYYLVKKAKVIAKRLPYRYRSRLYGLQEKYELISDAPLKTLKDLFFIVGSQRSGTTLLGLILKAHPLVEVFDEEIGYRILKSEVDFEAKPETQIVGFKTPVWTHRYKYLKANYPAAKIIYLQRNIKSVVSSMTSLQVQGNNWVTRNGIDDFERSLVEIQDKQYRKDLYDLFRVFKAEQDLISIATMCCYLKQQLVFEYRREDIDFLQIDYETLVEDPKRAIEMILSYLGLEWDSQVLQHDSLFKGVAIGDTQRDRPIDRQSLDKWRETLAPADIERIDHLVQKLDELAKDAAYPER